MSEETQELDEITEFLAQRDKELHVSYERIYDQTVSKLLLSSKASQRPMVLFVPGMMGSCLKDSRGNGDKPFWIDFNILRSADQVSASMHLKPDYIESKQPDDGSTAKLKCHWKEWMWTEPREPPGLVADDVVDLSVNLLFFNWHITAPYRRMVGPEGLGAVPFAFDWREDVRISAARFALFVRKLLTTAQTLRTMAQSGITLISHSMGCTVVVYAMGRYPQLFRQAETAGLWRNIELVTPAFRGAIGPMRLIDTGISESPLDLLVSNNSVLKDVASTTPSGFEMICAPRENWKEALRLLQAHWDKTDNETKLGVLAKGDYRPRRPDEIPYPIRHNAPPTGEMVTLSGWEEYPGVLASKNTKPWLIRGCHCFHAEMQQHIQAIERSEFPLVSKLRVWCGLNGKSNMYVLYDHSRQISVYEESGASVYSHPKLLWNGDGCLLLQTNVLPTNVPHLAILPSHKYSHSKFHRDVLLFDHVFEAMQRVLQGKPPESAAAEDVKDGVVPEGPAILSLDAVLPFVDWSHECRAHAWFPEHLAQGVSGRFKPESTFRNLVPAVVPNLYDNYLQKHLSVGQMCPSQAKWKNRGLCCELLQMAHMRRLIVPNWDTDPFRWARLSDAFHGKKLCMPDEPAFWGSARCVEYDMLSQKGRSRCKPRHSWWPLIRSGPEVAITVDEAVARKELQWDMKIQQIGEQLYDQSLMCLLKWRALLDQPDITPEDAKRLVAWCKSMNQTPEEVAWIIQLATQYGPPAMPAVIDLNSN